MTANLQISELENEGLSRKIQVTVPASHINGRVDVRLNEIAGQATLPGFRKGKVPAKILRSKYSRAILGEILEKIVDESSRQAIQDNALRPALQPRIEVTSFDEGQDLVYTMDFEIVPDFEVMDIKSIQLEKPVSAIPDEKIEESLKNIASMRSASIKIEEDRPAQNGDVALIDFAGRRADGYEHPGMKGEGHPLELGGGQFIPGFEEQLVGKKAGEKVEVKVTFPEKYPAEELAGQDCIFDVTIHELQEKKPAELDDALAVSLGLENLDALKDRLRENLKREYDSMSRMKLKRALLDRLDEAHPMTVPPTMLEQEYASILRQVESEADVHDHDHDHETCDDPTHDHSHDHDHGHGSTLGEEEKAELRTIADRRVRLGLVLSEIGRANNIEITDEDMQKAILRQASSYPGQERQILNFYRNNQQALAALQAPVFEEKVVDFILELAQISEKEVSTEELFRDEDEEKSEKSEKKASEAKETAEAV